MLQPNENICLHAQVLCTKVLKSSISCQSYHRDGNLSAFLSDNSFLKDNLSSLPSISDDKITNQFFMHTHMQKAFLNRLFLNLKTRIKIKES